MSSKKKVYALIVGINKYPNPVPDLKGCEADAKSVLEYLKSIEDIEVQEKILLGNEATKKAIVTHFLSHLGQADKEDVAFFFYAGHGTQEKAHEVFWASSPDKKLQSLVCYDGVVSENGEDKFNLLANKELRYLLHQIAKNNPHIVSIFDCCHSGQNTRSAPKEEDLGKRQFEDARYVNNACPERPWKDFIFANEISEASVRQTSLDEQLPEGRHIQIAACLRDESAYEWKKSGVFTQNLIEVLKRSENNITYYDLQSRIRNYIKNNFRQTPQIYTSGEVPNEVFRFFLNREASKGNPLYGRVDFKPGKGWIMDLGHIHGISKQAEKVQVVNAKGDEKFEATIEQVKPDRTLLKFKGNAPNKNESYKGFVDGFLSSPIKIYLNTEKNTSTQTATIFAEAIEQSGRNLSLAKKEYEADYTLHLKRGQGIITFSEDESRPLVPEIEPLDADGADLAAHYFNHISQWEFVKNLHNPNSYEYSKPPVKVEFFQLDESGNEELVPLKNDEVFLHYNLSIKGRKSGKIRVRLTNQYKQKLYVSFLYLSMNFQVYSKLLPKPVVGLNVEEESWARDGKPIKLTYEGQVERDNWKESITYFKLIIKNSHFDVGMLDQEALPSPVPEERTRAGRSKTREGGNVDAEMWTTRLITLRIKNPNYSGE